MADKVEKLTPEQVAQLHQSHQGTNHYDELVNYMTSGPSELLVLVKENASKSWQELVGPEEPAKASETAPTRFVKKSILFLIILFFFFAN